MNGKTEIENLYDASYQRLVLQLHPITGDLTEAQDVVQEAFVTLLAKPSRLASLDNPEAWLRRVAVNLARSRGRRAAILRRLLRRVEPTVSEVPGLSADHVALMSGLRKLPEGQRVAIALHHLADLPLTDVAETLGVPVGTVKARLSRGRVALAALVASLDTPPVSTSVPERSPQHA